MGEDNVIGMNQRLRDGRAVKTEKDFRQWLYEYFDKISQDFGGDGHLPSDILPPLTRVLVEWVDVVRGTDPEFDVEMAQTLAAAVNELIDCQRRCIQSAALEKP
jgi:hypothetical protein